MASDWQYDVGLRRYRNPQGRFLSVAQVQTIRDDYQAVVRERIASLAADLVDGVIGLPAWERGMRVELRRLHGALYALGKGGRNNMEPADWGHVGAVLKEQYRYLRGFTDDLAAGNLSPEQLGARAGLYVGSSTQAFERGKVATYGDLTLSRHPGDGQTACMTNCKCALRIVDTADAWHVYWTLGGANPCEDCPKIAAEWAPLVIAKQEEA